MDQERLNKLLEAEQAGTLSPDQSSLLNKARMRGLVPSLGPTYEQLMAAVQHLQDSLDYLDAFLAG